MKLKNLIFVTPFIASFTFSCGSKEEVGVVNPNFDTMAIANVLVDSVATQDSTNEGSDGEYQLNYIVAVEEGTNYFNLRSTALKVCKTLNVRFDTLERYYNPIKQRIVLPDDNQDDIYAGGYILRRYDDGFVSIEMRNAYVDINLKDEAQQNAFYKDTTKMFVFAAMSGNRVEADSIAKLLKKQFTGTKIIASKLYMGCMH